MTPESSTTSPITSSGSQTAVAQSLYLEHQDDVQKITNTYMKIYKIFFGIGLYMIVLIVSVVAGIALANRGDTTGGIVVRSAVDIRRESGLQAQLVSKDDQLYRTHDITVFIRPGYFEFVPERTLINANNLITYKGLVLPQNISINMSQGLSSYQAFSGQYDVSLLDDYMKQVILQTYRYDQNIDRTQLLPIKNGNFIDYFGLSCTNGLKIHGYFCNTVIQDTISVLPLYNLSQDYAGLSQFAQSVQGSAAHKLFCDAMQQYVFISNDTANSIREVMNDCGKTYGETVADFVSFSSIQDQLNRETISSTVTSSALLNAYKLISSMNTIFYEITAGQRINLTRISAYNNYVEALLKQSDDLQPFYFDVIARFNNGFLMPHLTAASVQARGNLVQDYKQVIDHLKKLNQGDTVAGYRGIAQYTINKSLIQLTTLQFDAIATGQINMLARFDESYNFANFVVRERIQSEDTITVSGLLRFDTAVGITNNTSMNAVFINQDQRFLAKSIQLDTYPQIAAQINPKLAIKPLPISEVYTMLIAATSTQTAVQDVCDIFEGNKGLQSCTLLQMIIDQGNVTYGFSYTDNKLTSFTISDKQLEAHARDAYGPTVSVAPTAVSAINLILSHKMPTTDPSTPTTSAPTGGLQEIQLQNHFGSIGATISKLTPQDGLYVVEFTLGSYQYVAVYDPAKQTITRLAVMIDGSPQFFRGVVFDFTTESQAQKDLLRNDPITFLIQKDLLTVRRLGLQ